MTARRKRSASNRASQRKKRHNTAIVKSDKPPEKHENVTMESKRSISTKYAWKKKPSIHLLEMSMIPTHRNFLPRYQRADQVAEWVFNVVKHCPVRLDLKSCERSEEVRDALLQKFHRWPETKIASAAEKFNTLNQQAEQRCQEQVQLYLQELREKLLGGTNALFWLDILQPLKHSALLPRHEVREVLVALLEEIRAIDGLFELLMRTNERLWAVLALPLRLEPLFQGVSSLALRGHEVSAMEAMQLLVLYAEQYTAFSSQKKRVFPLGLSVVASVGAFVPLDASNLNELPEAIREKLAMPLSRIIPDWIEVIGAVLDIVDKSLTSRWMACERAPYEEELNTTVQTALQDAFARFTHALVTDQLYAMRTVDGERSSTNGDPLVVTILSKGKMLIVEARRESLFV
ncbi:hypothetical protein PF008_g7969 [Phytophthora fragariae]|uniref:Uncharacterized protein n=2 Tax=Phytophthora fragariae TaxID=53985 RepID=A0A6G0S2J2_9STRA|nr:hypothetical protein PF008_g7969 [Phytophthora fragariae]